MVIYLFLPLAHSLARVAQYATLEAGGTLAFWGGDPSRIVEELAEIRPTHFPSVPRIYEKVHATVLNGVATQGRVKRALFQWALREGAQARAAAREGRPLSRARGHAPPRWPTGSCCPRCGACSATAWRWRCAAPRRSAARSSSSSTPAASSCSRATA